MYLMFVSKVFFFDNKVKCTRGMETISDFEYNKYACGGYEP